jgi:GH15 family glucan-1,4-alpha-glucosidase
LLVEDTSLFWQDWLRQSRYRGRWPELVNRSVITLKLLTYAPTGALIAAATMGLPEQIGGERNGNPDLPEETLEHVGGYRGSYPVRVGNGAADQLQLDIYGEALYALSQGREIGQQATYRGWKAMARTLDWLADHWDRPDEGIRETRGGRQDFTYSRVMSWVAFDQELSLAEHFRRPADVLKWRSARDAVLEQVMERGMQTYANHVRLFAEEVGPTGEQLGDFPQAFTHLPLTMAATTLDKALDAEQGR